MTKPLHECEAKHCPVCGFWRKSTEWGRQQACKLCVAKIRLAPAEWTITSIEAKDGGTAWTATYRGELASGWRRCTPDECRAYLIETFSTVHYSTEAVLSPWTARYDHVGD